MAKSNEEILAAQQEANRLQAEAADAEAKRQAAIAHRKQLQEKIEDEKIRAQKAKEAAEQAEARKKHHEEQAARWKANAAKAKADAKAEEERLRLEMIETRRLQRLEVERITKI